MTAEEVLTRQHLANQHHHWLQATMRLSRLENLASKFAWEGIDPQLSAQIRAALNSAIQRVQATGSNMSRLLQAERDYHRVKQSLQQFRDQYLKAETTVHFYTDALNSRTNAHIAALLRACDILCEQSMEYILPPLGRQVPKVLTYIDKGLGASILKAGLRLWDGSVSPVAAIKVTLHNLFRPTAIVHETGHQIAHALNWNRALAEALQQLKGKSGPAADAFSGWASEITADAFAFVCTGYGAVASLHNVVSGAPGSVFAFHAGDPHPISYVRVLLGTEMCRQFYGSGPWDELEENFKSDYRIDSYRYASIPLIRACLKILPDVVNITLQQRYTAFAMQSLAKMIDPAKVSPQALQRLHHDGGDTLFTSHAWVKECLRILALTTYRISTMTTGLENEYKQQEGWMIRLGNSIAMN